MSESILLEKLNNYLKSKEIKKLKSIPWKVDVEPRQNQIVIKCFDWGSLSHLISHPNDSHKIIEFFNDEEAFKLIKIIGGYEGSRASYFIFKETSN